MTNEELDRLEALAKKATLGPWRPCPQKSFIFGPSHEMIASRSRVQDEGEPEKGTVEIRGFGAGLPMDANHDFIVATSPDVVLRLVAELREARDQWDAATLKSKNVMNDALRMMGEMLRIEVILGTVYDETADVVASVREAVKERNALRAELTEARAEAERLRKIFSDAGRGEHDVLALIDHYQDEARRSHEARCEACESSATEIERLRAMVPSEDVTTEIRYAFSCTDYRPKDALAWIARVESAKENGR